MPPRQILERNLSTRYMRTQPRSQGFSSSDPKLISRAFDYILCPGVGNLTVQPSRGGKFDLCHGGVGKIEQEVKSFK